MNPSLNEQKMEPVTSGLLSAFCQSICCFEKPEAEVDGYRLCRVHAEARAAADQWVHDSKVARHVRMLAWAKATAAAPDDQTITIPAEFDRDEAMYALELEIMRGMQADAFMAPLTKAGQGRDPIDTPGLMLFSILVAVAALIALCVVLYFFAGRVLP